MTYEETLGRLAQTTSASLVGLWQAREAAQITHAQFLDLALTILRVATRQGLEVGALSIRANVEAVTGRPQPALTPRAPSDALDRRLLHALTAIVGDFDADDEGTDLEDDEGTDLEDDEGTDLEDDEGTDLEDDEGTEIVMRLDRLGRNEPIESATRGAAQAIRDDPRVTGWTRGLESDACQLCRWWHRKGRVWQPTHPMPRHTGCQCHPVPAVGDTSDNAQTTKQAWAAARARGKVAT